MPITFNNILYDLRFDLADVCLLRHQDKRASKGHSPYELWRDNRSAFEYYQSKQEFSVRSKLLRTYWASFVVTPNGETLFSGIYKRFNCAVLQYESPKLFMEGVDLANTLDIYELKLEERGSDLIGKLVIDWGGWGKSLDTICG